MKKRELIHPRKVMWAMRDFLNEASDLTYETIVFPSQNECDENNWNFWEIFEHGTTEYLPRECKMKNLSGTQRGFCAFNCYDEDLDYFEIGYNIEDLFCKGSSQFRQHFTNICPMAKGFADITITLLHELGHFSVEKESLGNYNRVAEIEFLQKVMPKELINYAYFMLPDEIAATMWAIEWLKDAENRKLAKAFEKRFFDCFK